MGTILAWQNLLFYIPLAVGLLLIVGAAFGLGEGHGHGDHDGGHDGGHDAGHDAASHDAASGPTGLSALFSVLGLGRIPLSISLSTAFLVFGGTGTVVNTALGGRGARPGVQAAIALAVASVATVVLTGVIARLLARFFPTAESYNITRRTIVGRTGTLVLAASASDGLAQVRDHEGNLHQIVCRLQDGGKLPSGEEILVVDYDEATSAYLIAPCPPDLKTEKHEP